jgi:hypothetical protein
MVCTRQRASLWRAIDREDILSPLQSAIGVAECGLTMPVPANGRRSPRVYLNLEVILARARAARSELSSVRPRSSTLICPARAPTGRASAPARWCAGQAGPENGLIPAGATLLTPQAH